MSESEEERRLRKEKKKEAARRAAEKEAKKAEKAPAAAPTATAASASPDAESKAPKETEEERRIRKEKKRAQREAEKKREEAAAAAGGGGSSSKSAAPTSEDKRAEKEARSKNGDSSKSAAAAEDGADGTSRSHRHREERKKESDAPPAKEEQHSRSSHKKPADANAELLSAIEAENKAVSARSPTSAAAAKNSDTKSEGKESEEERAARKQAEREERRRQRHAAKTTASGNGGDGAENGSPTAASPPAGPSPTTAFDPSELQRQAYRAQFEKDLARATALRRLVDFDSIGGVVVDLAPQTAYDLYIRDFGQSGREQAGVQAPPEEERLDVATQAERGRLRARGSQAPDDLGLCPEEEAERQFFQLRRSALQRTGRADASAGGEVRNDGDEAADGDDAAAQKAPPKKAVRSVDAALLERFLTSTLPVMSAVLDENNAAAAGSAAAAASGADGSGKSKTTTAFSSSYSTFCWRATRNRPLVQVMLNPSNTRQLIALHGSCEESGPSPVLDTYQSALLLWNVHDTATPERVLVSASAVTSVCVSPSRPHLIYGGTEDGNVCVWNLREPDRLHLAGGRFEKVVFHLPSYSTSWQADGHSAPVRQVRVAGYNSKGGTNRKDEHEQLVSMDETGVVCYWVVSDKESAGKGQVISDNDYGQHPFTSVSLHLAKGHGYANGGGGGGAAGGAGSGEGEEGNAAVSYAAAVAAGFDFSPTDTAQYVLTTPHGVVRRSRFGGTAAPSLYAPSCATYTAADRDDAKRGVAVVPCCVQYSVLDTRWFVVGYEDGTLRLFLQNDPSPKLTVEVGYQPVLAVRCSGTTPWVVWALDETGEVHLIDFAHHNRQTPRLSHALTQPDTGTCTCMDVSAKDEKADQRLLAAGFEKGMVQLHTLDEEKLRVANSERDEKWI